MRQQGLKLKRKPRAGKMAQRVKALATKPDYSLKFDTQDPHGEKRECNSHKWSSKFQEPRSPASSTQSLATGIFIGCSRTNWGTEPSEFTGRFLIKASETAPYNERVSLSKRHQNMSVYAPNSRAKLDKMESRNRVIHNDSQSCC
jgi:hypothetical protein